MSNRRAQERSRQFYAAAFFFCAIYSFLDEIVALTTNDFTLLVWLNVVVPLLIRSHEEIWPLLATFGAEVRIENEGYASFLSQQPLPLSLLLFSKALLVYLCGQVRR